MLYDSSFFGGGKKEGSNGPIRALSVNSRNSSAAPFVIKGAGLVEPLYFSESNILGPALWELGIVGPAFLGFEIFDTNFLISNALSSTVLEHGLVEPDIDSVDTDFFASNDLISTVLEHGLIEPDINSFLEIDSKVFGRLGEGSPFSAGLHGGTLSCVR